MFTSVKDFRTAYRTQHSDLKKVISLVFDNPIALSRYNIPVYDHEHNGEFTKEAFTETAIALDYEAVEVLEYSGFDITAEVTTELKQQATILNQLMTFIYSLPRSTHQNAVKMAVCRWMPTRKTLQQLEADIVKTPEAVLNDKQVTRLHTILSSPVANLYRDAMRDKGDTEEIAARMGVSAYELNYMRAIIAQGKKK